MSLEQDQPYIEKTLNGDMQAYTLLVDRYKHMVFTLALRMVKNREEAEEIAQDTFLKVYNALGSFKGDSKFSTWVYKIAYYRSLDYIKKSGRTLNTSPLEGLIENSIADEKDVILLMEQLDRKVAIKKALELLPGDDSALLTLHYYEELSMTEISEIMQLSSNNVKVKLFRARKRLEQILLNTLEPEIIHGYAKR